METSIELIKKGNAGKNVTTSRIIAKIFHKDHKHILRDIQNLDCSEEFNRSNFEPITYLDARNRLQKAYEITKDGFTFLVMGYSGSKASEFKEIFINEFTKRDNLLHNDDYILSRALDILNERNRLLQGENERRLLLLTQHKESVEINDDKISYYENILHSPSLIPTNIIAKELGMSAITLNKLLHKAKVIYPQYDTWVLYHHYQDKGYTGTKTYTYHDGVGRERTKIHIYWTEKGRKFIHQLVKSKLQPANS